MKETIKKAKKYAISEIEQYGSPKRFLFDDTSFHGVRIAKILGADEDIVLLGTILMDLKHGQAKVEGKLDNHIQMSADASREFLKQNNVDETMANKIINCVEGHHGTVAWTCKEAEICANADCYKFLVIKNWLRFICSLEGDFEKNIVFAEAKADEKWKILSLDVCKKELEPHYNIIKQFIEKVRSPSF